MPTLISTTTSPEIPARSASIGYLGAGVLIGRRLGAIGGAFTDMGESAVPCVVAGTAVVIGVCGVVVDIVVVGVVVVTAAVDPCVLTEGCISIGTATGGLSCCVVRCSTSRLIGVWRSKSFIS